MSHYSPRCFVLIGDDRQLPPTILSHHQLDSDGNLANCFSGQLVRPLFRRLKQLGHPSILFREQHRMVAPLSSYPSTTFYANRLRNAGSTALEQRPKAAWFTSFIRRHYRPAASAEPRMLLDVRRSSCLTMGTTRYNLNTAKRTMNVLQQLLADGADPKDIAIATFYQSQYEVYRAALRSLQKTMPDKDLKAIRIKMIDGYQGGEATYVLLDPVVTERVGFIGNRNRLNVALTRARDGLIVIGDISAINRHRDSPILTMLLDSFLEAQQVFAIRATHPRAQNAHVSGVFFVNPAVQ